MNNYKIPEDIEKYSYHSRKTGMYNTCKNHIISSCIQTQYKYKELGLAKDNVSDSIFFFKKIVFWDTVQYKHMKRIVT